MAHVRPGPEKSSEKICNLCRNDPFVCTGWSPSGRETAHAKPWGRFRISRFREEGELQVGADKKRKCRGILSEAAEPGPVAKRGLPASVDSPKGSACLEESTCFPAVCFQIGSAAHFQAH